MLRLNAQEIRILEIWYEKTVSGGHWGDGIIEIPEEQILMDHLRQGHEVRLSPVILRILRYWAEASSDTPEENSLKEKIQALKAQSV